MMMGGMGGPLASMLDSNKLQTDNKLTISWVDSSWVPILNANNVMEYFSDRRNPFYDPHSNNELLKMQRASLDQLSNMTGVEYCLLYVQEPILYVIRKQQRHSPAQVTPISDYYIVAGTIYQAPDLCSVVNSRLLSAVSHLQGAFEEARSYAKYHPTKGYWWDFQPNHNAPFGAKRITPPNAGDEAKKKKKKSEADSTKDEPSSVFQRVRVDALLKLLTDKFPPPQIKRVTVPVPAPSADSKHNDEVKSEKDVKTEKNEVEATSNNRGIKRENPSSSRPSSGMDQSKKMKFS